jgi:hypothetical protein
MANYGFNITDTTYAGTYESEYMITQATYSLDTINKGLCMVKDGIKKQHTIPRINITSPLGTRVATPNVYTFSGRTAEVDGVTLVPKDIFAYDQFNPRDFETNWFAEQLSPTLLAREIPLTPSNFLMQLYLNRCFEQIERGIWLGSTTYDTTSAATNDVDGQIKYFDGVIKTLMTTYSGGTNSYIHPSGAASAVTSYTATNIVTVMQNAYQSMPKAILANPKRRANLRFVMSVVDALKYEEYTTTNLPYKGNQPTDQGILRWKGIPVVAVAGMDENNAILLGEFTNSVDSILWVGVNSVDDLFLQIMKLQNNSEEWFFKFLFKIGIAISVPTQLYMHTNLAASYFNG